MREYVIRGGFLLTVVIVLSIWAAKKGGSRPSHVRRVPPPAAQPDSKPEPAVAIPSSPEPAPSPEPATAREPQPPAKLVLPGTEGLLDSDRSPTHRGLTVKQAREREELIAASRKREARNKILLEQNAKLWNSETRNAEWAEPIENDIRQILIDSEMDHMLIDVTCRKTVCRVEADVFRAHSDIQRLEGVPGFLEAIGGDNLSYSFESDIDHGQRVYVLLGRPPEQPRR